MRPSNYDLETYKTSEWKCTMSVHNNLAFM